jgi:hypothetical protein
MNVTSRLIKDISTGVDGVSYDVGRILLIVGAVAFIGLSIYAVIVSGTFDFMNYGVGYGAILGGGGAGIGMKAKTEPSGLDGN